jgi:hypothetical protein
MTHNIKGKQLDLPEEEVQKNITRVLFIQFFSQWNLWTKQLILNLSEWILQNLW